MKKQQLPAMPNLLNERPKGMSFTDYKQNLKIQREQIKQRKKGFLFWASNGIGDTTKPIGGGSHIGFNGRMQKIYGWLQKPQLTLQYKKQFN